MPMDLVALAHAQPWQIAIQKPVDSCKWHMHHERV